MGYGLLRALLGDRAFLPPSSLRSLLPKNLTPASGRQDHTTSPSASARFVSCASASIASRAALMTLANAPLWLETRNLVPLICPTAKGKYFCEGGWTGPSGNYPTGKSVLNRRKDSSHCRGNSTSPHVRREVEDQRAPIVRPT